MKSKTQKGLYVLVSIVLFCFSVNAQIIYTDPADYYATSGSYNLDINDDGNNDYTFKAIYFHLFGTTVPDITAHSVYLKLHGSNCNINYSEYPASLNLNDTINSASDWNCSYDDQILRSYFKYNYETPIYHGNWISSDHYLGVTLVKAGHTYYGWIKMTATATSGSQSFTIKSYAYNSVANAPILAGETSCTTPTISISEGGPLSICEGGSVELNSTGSGYLYQWRKNDVDIVGATYVSYTATTAGIYTCRVTNSCGSVLSEEKIVKVVCTEPEMDDLVTRESEFSNLADNDEILISPNPFSNSTRIIFGLEHAENVLIRIYDLNGKLIDILSNEMFNEGENQVVWNGDDGYGNKLSDGIYLLNLETAEFSLTEKLIVSH